MIKVHETDHTMNPTIHRISSIDQPTCNPCIHTFDPQASLRQSKPTSTDIGKGQEKWTGREVVNHPGRLSYASAYNHHRRWSTVFKRATMIFNVNLRNRNWRQSVIGWMWATLTVQCSTEWKASQGRFLRDRKKGSNGIPLHTHTQYDKSVSCCLLYLRWSRLKWSDDWIRSGLPILDCNMSPFDIGFPNVWRVIRPDWKMNSTWITTIKKKKKISSYWK